MKRIERAAPRQQLYLELVKSGYTLQEICYETNRHPSTIMNVLRSAMHRPCKTESNCCGCLTRITCERNRKAVETFMSRERFFQPATMPPEPRQGRYSY